MHRHFLASRLMLKKKRPTFQRGAFASHANNALIDYDKVRVALADHPLRVRKTVHVNRHPAAVQKHEVAVPDQSEMVRPVSLDEELFRMPPETEHFAVTRSKLFLVYRRRLIRVHVRLARAGKRTRLIPVYFLSATLNACVRLSTYVRAGLRFRLCVRLLLSGTHLLPLGGSSSLRLFRLPLRLLRFLRCLTYRHKRQCQGSYGC